MEKMRKRIICGVLIFVLTALCVAPASATQPQNEASPLYVVNIDTTCYCDVSASNELTVANTYSVNDSQITRVVVTTYVEKRSLLVIWNRIDIGETNNEWVDYGSNGHFSKSHTAQLPSSGTYRVTTVFEIYGGSVLLDTAEKTTIVEC